jgi:hypothetical protein
MDGQSDQPDDPDGAEREISTITDSADAAPLVRSCSEDARVKISTHGVGEGRRARGRPRTKWHDNIQNALLEREWTGDRPDHGHKTERYDILFAKPLHLTVDEARLCEVKWSKMDFIVWLSKSRRMRWKEQEDYNF